MANPRKIAVLALNKINSQGAYSNIAVNSFLKESDLTPNDKAFATALIYWTISAISGVTLLGVAEIIKLLTEIKNK